MNKKAITSFSTIEPESNFIAGMPNSPQGAGPGGTLTAAASVQKVKMFPGTTASKGEAGMSDVIAEGANEMVAQLERKFGSSHPFVMGFVSELQKDAGIGEFFKKMMPAVAKKVVPEATLLQRGVNRLNAVKERTSTFKPQLAIKTPMQHETFPVDRETSRFHTRMSAKAAKGRWEPRAI